jgi:hypothetical protein
LVSRPVPAANISPPAFFRVIQDMRPTLLIDEADTFLRGSDELRGILNAGYSRETAFVMRVASQLPPHPPDPRANTTDPAHLNDGRRFPLSTAEWEKAGLPSIGQAKEGLSSVGLTKEEVRGRGSSPLHAPAEVRRSFSGRTTQLATFSCWCPKAMAAIGRLPDTLADRCIVIRMERKTAREQCERSKDLDPSNIRRQCARFVVDHQHAIAVARPDIPPSLNDRAADIWEPLLALADLAGSHWPELARQAAIGLSASAQDHNPIGALLLDIFVLFSIAEVDRIFTRTLLDDLNKRFTDRPWMDMTNGKPVTEMWLAQKLRPYGIQPRTLRQGEVRAKGYFKADFTEAFRRYIPSSEIEALKTEANAATAPR